MKSKILSVIAVLFLMLNCFSFQVMAEDNINQYVSEILDGQCGGDIQEWINGDLSVEAGITAEWYVLALSQSGDYDFSSYISALQNYINTNEVYSASTRLKYALAFAAVGSNSSYITETLKNSAGQQGIMSWVYALHLLNNGYTCENYSVPDVINQLLSMQLPDGGWAIMGEVSDVDVTAMTLQALASCYSQDDSVQSAVDRAIEFLSDAQQSSGGYKSFGADNLESIAEVVVALTSLGIEPFSDERFIKQGNTLLNGMEQFRLADGSYSHTVGTDSNQTATAQALHAFIACQRLRNNQSSLYILDHANENKIPETSAKSLPGEPVQSSWKLWAICLVTGTGGLICIVFWVLKKRSWKNFVFIGCFVLVGDSIVLLMNIQSADEYYGSVIQKENPVGTVTMTIRCDTIAGKIDSEYVPENGIILETTDFAISEGDTAYMILIEAAQAYHIQVEHDSSSYISGINHLYELQFGDLSGWIYRVNGETQSVGCGECVLKDGDSVEWLYSCEIGNDID